LSLKHLCRKAVDNKPEHRTGGYIGMRDRPELPVSESRTVVTTTWLGLTLILLKLNQSDRIPQVDGAYVARMEDVLDL